MLRLRLRGCSKARYCVIPVRARYAVGDVVYRCDLAAIGLSEGVKIKEIIYTPSDRPYSLIYKDTLNSVHNEAHLCLKSDADALIAAYAETQRILALRRSLPCQDQ